MSNMVCKEQRRIQQYIWATNVAQPGFHPDLELAPLELLAASVGLIRHVFVDSSASTRCSSIGEDGEF